MTASNGNVSDMPVRLPFTRLLAGEVSLRTSHSWETSLLTKLKILTSSNHGDRAILDRNRLAAAVIACAENSSLGKIRFALVSQSESSGEYPKSEIDIEAVGASLSQIASGNCAILPMMIFHMFLTPTITISVNPAGKGAISASCQFPLSDQYAEGMIDLFLALVIASGVDGVHSIGRSTSLIGSVDSSVYAVKIERHIFVENNGGNIMVRVAE